jgi:Ca-activated chloride channel family protein
MKKILILLFASGSLLANIASNTLTPNPLNAEVGSFVFENNSTKTITITQVALDSKVNMEINGIVARVKVEQTFSNPNDSWIGGTYVFPLPDTAAVDRLTMLVDGRTIIGEIKTKQEAKKIYEKAKKSGKKASLIEQQRPNIFTSKVANISPFGKITIIIEYLQQVKMDSDGFEIRLPLVVGDRYTSGVPIDNAGNTHIVKDASKLQSPISNNKRNVEIDVNLNAGFEIHNLKTSFDDAMISGNLKNKQIKIKGVANQDFVLNWKNNNKTPVVAVFQEKLKGDEYFMLLTLPQVEIQNTQNREVIFVIDSSGSMSGVSMRQAKIALKTAINRLDNKDRFNIIDFDSKVNPLFLTPQLADSTHKKLALEFNDNLVADNGTEILKAIDYSLNSFDEDSANYLRQVIFITDGYVSNESEIFKKIKHDIGDSSFYSIGIGSAPNSYLMRKMSEIGNGSSIQIDDINQTNIKMQKLFKQLENLALRDIKITSDENLIQAKTTSNKVFAGDSFVKLFKAKNFPKQLTINGKYNDENFSQTINLKKGNTNKGIATFWHRKKIEDLYDNYQFKASDKLKQEITDFALNAHLVSQFTSLVAVDKTPKDQLRPEYKKLLEQKLSKQKVKGNSVSASNTAIGFMPWLLLSILSAILAIFIRFKIR